MNKTWFSFTNATIILTIFLFIVILVLCLYLFDIIRLPKFSSNQTNTASSENQTNTTDNTNKKALLNPLPKIFVNDTDKWMLNEVPDSKIKVLSDIQIDTAMLVKFQQAAPTSSNAGIVFDNGLKDDDPNLRRISLLYFLELKRWSLKYQAGKTTSYTPVIAGTPEKIFGSFSLLIPSDGKSVIITLQNKTKKTINLPKSLYEISNQMVLKTQLGAKSNITYSSLNYQIDPQ